jgi:hypothetical protein
VRRKREKEKEKERKDIPSLKDSSRVSMLRITSEFRGPTSIIELAIGDDEAGDSGCGQFFSPLVTTRSSLALLSI